VTVIELDDSVLLAEYRTAPPPPPPPESMPPAPPPPTTSTSTAVSVEPVTSNVPLDVNVWMVYSPAVVTVPPVAREEEHEPLGDAGDAGDDDAVIGSLNTRTSPCPAK
jgi:hypothetical protein